MEQPYTQEHLVQFIYKETPVLETFEIEDALENNAVLANQCATLMSAFNKLPEVKLNPSDQTILRLLDYSRKSAKVSC